MYLIGSIVKYVTHSNGTTRKYQSPGEARTDIYVFLEHFMGSLFKLLSVFRYRNNEFYPFINALC